MHVLPGLCTLNIFEYEISLICGKFRNHHREPLFGHGNTFDRGRPVSLPLFFNQNLSRNLLGDLRDAPGIRGGPEIQYKNIDHADVMRHFKEESLYGIRGPDSPGGLLGRRPHVPVITDIVCRAVKCSADV